MSHHHKVTPREVVFNLMVAIMVFAVMGAVAAFIYWLFAIAQEVPK